MGRVYCLHTLWVENFAEIALSRTVKEIEAILCFSNFAKNPKFKMAAKFENFLKVGIAYCVDTPGVENFDEIALSHTVKEIEAILCFLTQIWALSGLIIEGQG